MKKIINERTEIVKVLAGWKVKLKGSTQYEEVIYSPIAKHGRRIMQLRPYHLKQMIKNAEVESVEPIYVEDTIVYTTYEVTSKKIIKGSL